MNDRLNSIICLYIENNDIEPIKIQDMLTLEERVLILKNKKWLKLLGDKVCGNLFSILEADNLFEKRINLTDDLQKYNLYICLSDQKFIKNFNIIFEIKDKKQFVRMINSLSSDYSKTDCLQKIKVLPSIISLFDDKGFIKIITEIISNLADDRLKNLCLGEYKTILSQNDIAYIISTFNSDKLKVKYIDEYNGKINENIYRIISSLNSDKLKLKYLDMPSIQKGKIIASLNKDSLKETMLNKYVTKISDVERALIISSFGDDRLKEKYMIFVHEKNNKYKVLKSFNDPSKVIRWAKRYKNISDDMLVGIIDNVFDKDEYKLELFDLINNQDMLICAYQCLNSYAAKLQILDKLINKMYALNTHNDNNMNTDISLIEKLNYLSEIMSDQSKVMAA